MSGEIPVWLFAVCLVAGMATAFLAGYEWCGWTRRRRLRREVAAARRRQEQREAAREAGRRVA